MKTIIQIKQINIKKTEKNYTANKNKTKITMSFIVFLMLQIILIGSNSSAQNLSLLKIGDVIFHKSQSAQSKALNEATGSPWTHVGIIVKDSKGRWSVAEAIGPVKITPLSTFIGRGKNKHFRIYRHPEFDPTSMTDKLYAAIKKHNKAYDIYFEFSDERTYCSELVYKAMMEVMGREVGHIQKMKEMKLTGPYVKALIKKRLTDTGRELNPDEPIITPVSQLLDNRIVFIQGNSGI